MALLVSELPQLESLGPPAFCLQASSWDGHAAPGGAWHETGTLLPSLNGGTGPFLPRLCCYPGQGFKTRIAKINFLWIKTNSYKYQCGLHWGKAQATGRAPVWVVCEVDHRHSVHSPQFLQLRKGSTHPLLCTWVTKGRDLSGPGAVWIHEPQGQWLLGLSQLGSDPLASPPCPGRG